MPTVLRIGPYRFHFYSRENDEPAHIHVERDDFEAKFWLNPVYLARNHGFQGKELNKLAKLVEKHQPELLEAWRHTHG